jgi:pimeloyl-ACP methyl ester carboxylesterase
MPDVATSADGTRIAYECHGAGVPALVFVHGWSGHRRYWDAQIPAFCDSARVIAIDLGGHGESGTARQDWSMAAFGADVAAVIDELALDEVVLIGHSMGADVILEMARRRKDGVRGLVWVDQHRQLSQFRNEDQVQARLVPFRADFAATARGFARGLFPAAADPALVARIATDMASAPPRVALGALESTWNYGRSVPAILAELHLPVVAINPQSPSTDIDSLRRHGVDAVLIPDVGHYPMMERPQAFNACLVAIVERLIGREI